MEPGGGRHRTWAVKWIGSSRILGDCTMYIILTNEPCVSFIEPPLPWHGASISIKRELCLEAGYWYARTVYIAWVKPFPVCRATRRKRNTALTKEPCHIWRRHNVSDSFLTGTCADNRKQSFGSSCSLTIRFLIVSFKLPNCQISHKKRTKFLSWYHNSYLDRDRLLRDNFIDS